MELVKKAGVYKIYLILALFLLLLACEKNGYNAPEEQPVYFEYHYVNFAWGLQDQGWLEVWGDYQQYNQSAEADTLAEWLKGLQQSGLGGMVGAGIQYEFNF